MKHIFDVDLATEHGIEKAVILENIVYWVRKNEANDTHKGDDGEYYTYNSAKAFAELFPYIKNRRMEELLRQMEQDGLIKSRNDMNQTTWDKTKWYTIGPNLRGYYDGENAKTGASNIQKDISSNIQNCVSSILQKQEHRYYKNRSIDPTKIGDSSIYTYINTDINTDINMPITAKAIIDTPTLKKTVFVKPSLDEIKAYCIERKNTVDPERFYNFYESKGWYVGKNSMKNWKAAVRTWEANVKTQVQSSNKPLKVYERKNCLDLSEE